MKKYIAIIVAIIMLFTLAACGDKENNDVNNDVSDNQVESVDGAIKTSLFSLEYDDKVWTYYSEDTVNEEDYSYIVLQIPDPEDTEYYLINAEIEVDVDEPYDFRDDLAYYGFNQYEYEVNKAYETVKIGGVDLLKYDDEDDTVVYFNRIEGAGATVTIEFDTTDTTDTRIDDLLKGLTITLEDIGNEDGPWEWEGTPFSAESKSVQAGSLTVRAEWIKTEEYIATNEVFDHSVAAIGNTVYLLVDGELRKCIIVDGELTFSEKIELPEDEYDMVEATADGALWVSGSMNDVICIKNDKIVATYEDLYDFAIHPSGTWGVDYFTSEECNIVTFSGDTYTTTPITFKEADTIMHLNVDENNIYVCANAKDESGHKVFIYNKDGVLQKTLCDSEGEGLGSVTFVAKSANGYIGFDGNMRDVLLWDNDGNFVAEISDGDLFSTNYPWFCNSALLSDGSIISVMTEEREDKSATELIVFKVSGF